eukprot:5844525-Pleurochrysis_carterae.AAC.3
MSSLPCTLSRTASCPDRWDRFLYFIADLEAEIIEAPTLSSITSFSNYPLSSTGMRKNIFAALCAF